MNFENLVASIGLTFFCNSMVEELYAFETKGLVSGKLEKNCRQAVIEFESFKWPLKNVELVMEARLFNTNYNLDTLVRALGGGNYLNEEFVDTFIGNLGYILDKNKPTTQRIALSKKLRKFFDTLGDYSFYASRECIRN